MFAEVVAQWVVLAHLALSRNQIGPDGAERLAQVLAQCPTMTHLDLSYSGIGPAGAESSAGVLAQYQSLTHLNLSYNEIGADRLESLAGVLAQCPSLSDLDLNYNGTLVDLDLSNTGVDSIDSIPGLLFWQRLQGSVDVITELDLDHGSDEDDWEEWNSYPIEIERVSMITGTYELYWNIRTSINFETRTRNNLIPKIIFLCPLFSLVLIWKRRG